MANEREARRPGAMVSQLRALARLRPIEALRYLKEHGRIWSAFARHSPADAADIMEEIGLPGAHELFADLADHVRANVVQELRDDLAAELLWDLAPQEAARVLETMSADEAADVLATVEVETADQLLDAMDTVAAEKARELLQHHPQSAGGLMTTNIAALHLDLTVGEAMEQIRAMQDEIEDLSYVYVVDDDRHLVGVVSFRDLVFHHPEAGLDQAMVPPVAVTTSADRGEVADLVQRYHLSGLPVTDRHDVLVGVVPTDRVLAAVQQEASEDFALAVGTTGEDSLYLPAERSIGHRLPWISLDVALSLVVVLAVSEFDEVITTSVVLAALMPLVARVGGDAGAQALAVVIRGLATEGVPGSQVGRVLRREGVIGLVNGLVIGVLAGAAGFGLQMLRSGPTPGRVALALFLAAVTNLAVAGISGAAIPLLLRRYRQDPALGSNLILTTITDLIGFAGFLAIATILL